MKIAFLTLILSITIFSCSSTNDFNKGKQQLEAQGYSSVENTGYSWFCCDEKDTYSSGFSAKDKFGKEVKGCICSGVLKGITIRFE